MSPVWNLSELMSQTTLALGERSDLAQSTVSFWVNEAAREVYSQFGHDPLEKIAVSSTTINEDKITLPSDFEELLAFSNTSRSNQLLDQINVDQLAAYSDQSGVPKYYALYSTWVELRPTPDSAYSLELRYRAQPSDMTTLTDHPSIATRLRRGIMLKAKELLAEHVIQDSQGAALARNAYVSFVESMPSDRALRMREQHAMGLALPRERGQKTQKSSTSFDVRID